MPTPLAPFLADVHTLFHPTGSRAVLSENEVSRTWAKIFKSAPLSPDLFQQAETLLDELRPTSPLRHRLSGELDELRSIHSQRVEA
jgi:hypothetical protein